MKSCEYWQYKGKLAIEKQDERLACRGDRLEDIPAYIQIYFFVLMYLLSPHAKAKITKGDRNEECDIDPR